MGNLPLFVLQDERPACENIAVEHFPKVSDWPNLRK